MLKKLLLLGLFLLPLPVNAQTAGSFISQLTPGTSPTGAELFPVWQNNVTKRLTLNQLQLGVFLPVVNGDCITGVGGLWVAGSCSGSSGSGTVTSGVANQLAWYPSSSNSVSGLALTNNAVLVTSATGAPSESTTLPNGISATTQTAGDSSTKLATDAFVNNTALTLANGTTASTQTTGDSSTKVATTAFVNGTALTLTNGTTATTQTSTDNSTKVATTAFVQAQPVGFSSCTIVSNPTTATCAGGYTLTGGGCQSNNLSSAFYNTYPSSSTTWTCNGGTAYAICCH